MNIKRIITIIFLALIAYFIFNYISNKPTQQAIHNPKIAVTIFPLKNIAQNIVGDEVEIVQILPSGASPHTYSLTPKQLLELKDVNVLFYIGEELDDWIVQDLKDQDIPLIKVSSDIETILEGDKPNPHYWLNYNNAKIIAKNILQAIITYEPSISVITMSNNLANWLNEIDVAYGESLAKIETINADKRKIITFHDAWGYFAKDLGLEIVAEFEPFPGKTPTAEYIANLQKTAFQNNIWVIYSEPQLASESIKSFVNDMGMKLKTLDPLGGTQDTDTFIKLMEYNVDQIIK